MKRWALGVALLVVFATAGRLRADWEPEGTLQVLGTEGGLRLFRFETEPWPLEAGRPLPDNSRVELDAGAKLRLRFSHYLDLCLAGPARLTVYVVPAPGDSDPDQDRVVLKLDEGTLLVDARFQFGRPADIVLSLPDTSLPLPADQRFFAQASAGHATFYVPVTLTPPALGAWPARFDKAQGRIIVQAPSDPKGYRAPVPEALYEELQRPVRVFVLGRDFNQDLGLWPRPAVLGPLLAERLAKIPGLQVVDGSGDTFFAYRANNALKSGQDFFLKEMGRARDAQWVVAGNCVAETALASSDPEGRGRRVRGLTELRLLETEGNDDGLELVSENANTLVARAGRPLELAVREAMEASSSEAAGYLEYHIENLLAGRSHADKLLKLQFEGAGKDAWASIRAAMGRMDSVERVFRRSFSGGVLKVDVMLRKEESDFLDQWKSAPWKGGAPQPLGESEDGSQRYRMSQP
jgi:hypothetical protein